jgi:glycosyltransferase involved in cell wall biosynthesis
MDYALTVYPLSRDFREAFEQSIGSKPTYMTLSELRKLHPLATLRHLRRLRGERFILAIEDEASLCILPVMTSVAGFASTRHVEIFYPDLTREPISSWRAVPQVVRLLGASGMAMWDAHRCDVELSHLLAAPRKRWRRPAGDAVLYLNANLWFGAKAGGSVGHVAGVVNALHDTGRAITFASVTGRTMIHDEIPSIALTVPAVMGFPSELNYYRFQRMAGRQMLNAGPPPGLAFLYQRMSVGNYLGVVLSRAWQVPLVMEYNGSEVWIARNWGRQLRRQEVAAKAEEVALRHADVVVTISEVLRDELLERGVEAERIVCYPNCVDPAVFDPARFTAADNSALRRQIGVPDDALIAMFVGTFGSWHGVDVLANGIRALIDADEAWVKRTKLHFVLVGDGVKMPIVREILEGPKYAPYFTLTGLVPQAQAPRYLNAADFLLTTHGPNPDGSPFFGSPTKLFEYMVMGKGLLAPDLDQIGQVLKNSLRTETLPTASPSNGDASLSVLFPPGDIAALVTAIKFLAENRAWREILGRNARNEALAKYTWAHHVDAILKGVERSYE